MHIEIARNSAFDCHLSPDGRQMAIEISGDKWQSKTLFSTIFYLRSSIVLTFSIAAYLGPSPRIKKWSGGGIHRVPMAREGESTRGGLPPR